MVTKANNNKSYILGVILPLHHSLACFFFSVFVVVFIRSKVCNILMKTHCSQTARRSSIQRGDWFIPLWAYRLLYSTHFGQLTRLSQLSSQLGRARTGFWMGMKADYDLNVKIHISPTPTCQKTHVCSYINMSQSACWEDIHRSGRQAMSMLYRGETILRVLFF